MKKVLSFIISILTVTLSVAEPPKDKGYTLLFEDNFDGDSLNSKHWRPREGRRMTGLNLSKNISVSDGKLRIALKQEMIDGKMENTGGGVISIPQFGYGYYECLSKPFTKGGVHSSFWQSQGNIPNNDIFEIDSYEIFGGALAASNNLYLHIKPRDNNYAPYPFHAVIPFTVDEQGWVLDGYEYTPQGVIFYDNGKEVARTDWGELTAAQCVWITALNLRVKKNEGLPDEGLVDYFRYYAKDYPGVNILPNGNFEYNSARVDRYRPIAWQQEGTPSTALVIDQNAYRDLSKLRLIREEGSYEIKVFQDLEYILNGEYALSAMVRSSGRQDVSQMIVSGFGNSTQSVNIERCDKWTRVEIPSIKVTNNKATIAFLTKASANQWIEIDNVEFLKPAPANVKVKADTPFVVVRDPFWSTAEKSPIICHGDGTIIGLSDNIGTGNATTISFEFTADKMENASIFAKLPKSGKSGKGIYLRKNGDVIFRIGSRNDFTEVAASKAYKANQPCRITCVYDYGTASLYIDNKLIKEVCDVEHDTNVGGGRFGDVQGVFTPIDGQSIIDYHNQKLTSDRAASIYHEFTGKLRDIKFYNRAISKQEAINQ